MKGLIIYMASAENVKFDRLIFAKRLSDLRESRNLKQKDLANETGFTLDYIKKWESCERDIKAPHLFKLSKFFRVSVDYLIGASEDKSPNVNITGARILTGLSEECINVLSKPKNFTNAEQQIISNFIIHEKFIDLINSISEYIYVDNYTDQFKVNETVKPVKNPQNEKELRYKLFEMQELFIEIVKDLSKSTGEKT